MVFVCFVMCKVTFKRVLSSVRREKLWLTWLFFSSFVQRENVWMDYCHFLLMTEWPVQGKLIKNFSWPFWAFIICSITHPVLIYWYCVSCILSVSWRNFSCQADGCLCQDCLSSLPQQALPHLAKRRSMVAGAQYSLQPIWRFVVLNFLSETFRDCYNTCLDKIIGRYCNFFCIQYLCSFDFCLHLYIVCCLHLKFCLIHILFSL